MRRLIKGSIAAGIMVLASPTAALADPPEPANSPEPVDTTPIISTEACPDFAVKIQLGGKTKTIELPGGRVIATAPGETATLTNLEDTYNTVSYVITGAFHETTLEDGSVVTHATGRNILFDPEAGFVLATGSYSYTFDAEGNLTEPLNGTGTLTDLCAALS